MSKLRTRDAWHEIEREVRKLGRWRKHRHYAVLYLFWAGAILCAVWETIVCRMAVQALDTTWPFFLFEAGLWAATLCWVGPDALRHWRQQVAMRLYHEDIADGVCSDRGMQITAANGWRWYKQRGSPLWISSKRVRPKVRVGDAFYRLYGDLPRPQPVRGRDPIHPT
ncbi:hypothetical protein LGN09_04095 [Burkholderia cenocepacia]|uniref:hypothetical protein n=1 Tax=Burkholderia cenocepacia TaxID=95486 RepID=UPI001B8FAD39|nr:hypothetical protein [Burkholderia cenocepacia]MBR7985276.1 hypothetical protein [Burkholderia cenocepacia]MCA8404057.1 hypothetical protein [Burkholderia cenocepacia]